MLLLEAQELPQVLADLQTMPDPYVQGILVESAPPAGVSLAASFPLAAFAPYAAGGYEWNPKGEGLLEEDFSIPIVQLDKAAAVEAARRANDNELKVSTQSYIGYFREMELQTEDEGRVGKGHIGG